MVNEWAFVTADHRNAAQGVAATTRTRSTGRVPHRVDRTPMSSAATPSTALAVTMPLAGRMSTQGASPSAATARSSCFVPVIWPCQAVASPSRIVGWASRSTNVGAALGRVNADHAVTTAHGVAMTRRSGRRHRSAHAMSATAAAAAREVGRCRPPRARAAGANRHDGPLTGSNGEGVVGSAGAGVASSAAGAGTEERTDSTTVRPDT